jgi:signal recognition particle subunit SRP54
MAFEGLSEKLQAFTRKLSGKARISESDLNEMLREVKLALLEADVNFKVVKEFINNIHDKALGQDVLKSLTPGQQVVKIVKDELIELLGGTDSKIAFTPNPPTIIMLVGLQGSGKTTASGKIANLVRKKYKKNPLLVACDIYRPAAIDQLQTIGKELNIPVFTEGKIDVNTIVTHALEYAKENGNDYILIDTAGRLHIDEALMDELEGIINLCHPQEVLLVIDAMMGQDAINVITGFNDKLKLTGCILTKLDGDTKGGVALSVRHLTNVPIKFVGDSEKMDGLSPFYPERMAERILDMGDVLSIAEKVEGVISEEDAEAQAKRMMSGKYDLEDFLKNMKQIKKLGPLENILKLLPQARQMGIGDVKIDPKDMAHIEAIVLSMTPYERKHPECLKASRKQRISKGCGRDVAEINRLLKQFEEMKKMMKMMGNGNMKLPF